jgi:hypothetical protein
MAQVWLALSPRRTRTDVSFPKSGASVQTIPLAMMKFPKGDRNLGADQPTGLFTKGDTLLFLVKTQAVRSSVQSLQLVTNL